jgi:hypothetical protein
MKSNIIECTHGVFLDIGQEAKEMTMGRNVISLMKYAREWLRILMR